MRKRYWSANALRVLLFILAFSVTSGTWAAVSVSDSLVGALFGTAYLTSFNVKEVDFYVGQILFDRNPTGFSYFDTSSTTFGTDITIFKQGRFNWFVGTERLGRTGGGALGSKSLQWNIPVEALYSGMRFDTPDSVPWQPYAFCIGGLYSMSDLLGSDTLVISTTSGPVTYTNSTYNITGTTLGLELGLGFTPITMDNVTLSVEGNYRFANFSNVAYSPASSSLPALPSALPNSIDYSGWSVALDISFEPDTTPKDGTLAAREKLFAGNIPFDKKTFTNAVTNCDPYLVDLFLKAGFKPEDGDLEHMVKKGEICDEVKEVFFVYAAQKHQTVLFEDLLGSGLKPNSKDLKSLYLNPKVKDKIKDRIKELMDKKEEPAQDPS